MQMLVVYYSRSDSTRTVAKALAHGVGGTLRELVDANDRKNLFAAAMAASVSYTHLTLPTIYSV